MADKPFIEILDECIDRVLREGEQIDVCVAAYPVHAEELRAALESAVQVEQSFAFSPDSDRKRAARLHMMQALDKRTSRQPNPLKVLFLGAAKSSRRWTVAVMALVVALSVGGTGTVLASNESIPGDKMYPVKRASERAQLLVTFSDEKEADLHAALLERRVKEMEATEVRGRERFVPELAEQIEQHAQRARALAEAPVRRVLANTKGNQHPDAGSTEPETTPSPNNTPEVLSARMGTLLQVKRHLSAAEQRLIFLSDKPLNGETKQHLQEALRNIQVRYQEVNRILELAEQMRDNYTADPEDVRRITKEFDEQRQDNGYTDNSNGTNENDQPGRLVRQRATIDGVNVVQAGGRLRIDLSLVMKDGSHRIVHLSRKSQIEFLNAENKQATLHDLTLGGTLQLGIHSGDGTVKVIRLGAPMPNSKTGASGEESYFQIVRMSANPEASAGSSKRKGG